MLNKFQLDSDQFNSGELSPQPKSTTIISALLHGEGSWPSRSSEHVPGSWHSRKAVFWA